MNVGMLWFDNDAKSEMKTKIQRAAAYYQKKYGQQPNLCYVHPSMLPSERLVPEQVFTNEATPRLFADDIEVRATRSVLPHHFWIGVSAEPIFAN